MPIPPLSFKIAIQLIQEQLDQQQEPADLPIPSLPQGQSALRLLRKQTETSTAAAPKVVTDSGQRPA